MHIIFLGVGEACDERYPNTSILIQYKGLAGQRTVLLDCGFSIPHIFFKYITDPDTLDGLWISHFHGDHFMGVPLLLLRFWEMKRKKPLYIIGQPHIDSIIEQAMDLAYPGFRSKMSYEFKFVSLNDNTQFDLLDSTWQVALSEHSQRNLALRLQKGDKSVYFSGDGYPTLDCTSIASNATLMIHEGFWLNQRLYGHGSVESCISFARETSAENLAIVHMQRDERRNSEEKVKKRLQEVDFCKAFLPEQGDKFEI